MAVIVFFSRSVEAIVSKHPDQKDAKDSMGRIPLHHACSEEVQTQAFFFYFFFVRVFFVFILLNKLCQCFERNLFYMRALDARF